MMDFLEENLQIITIEITKWNECPDYIWHRSEGYSKLWMNDEYRDRFIA